MTAVVETFRKRAVMGDLKLVVIKTDANCATGHTVDMNSDVADGRAMEFAEILGAFLQNETGTDVASPTYVVATGIITMPSISTGIHKLTVWGY
jgi:hypothetical protein